MWDLVLGLSALRFFFVLIGLGIALGFWHQWLLQGLYVLFITLALVFYYRSHEQIELKP
jgi:hypothetical protein